MRFQNSKSVFHTQIYPDSKYKLILIRSAKQLGKCFSQGERRFMGGPTLRRPQYWSQAMKDALGMHQDGGFRFQLSLTKQNIPTKPIPAVDFSEKIQSNIGDVLNKELKIYVTPTEFFTTKFRQIFKNTHIKFTTSKYTRKWLGGPHMSFWPQQLNFALWCATTGCGISRDILFSSDSSLDLSPQLRSFYLFHVYFTVRCILYEMGGIQSMSALTDDPTFNQKDNHYDIASNKRICAEFGVDPSSDFRFIHGQNHGLGYVNIKYPDGHDFAFKKWTYPQRICQTRQAKGLRMKVEKTTQET